MKYDGGLSMIEIGNKVSSLQKNSIQLDNLHIFRDGSFILSPRGYLGVDSFINSLRILICDELGFHRPLSWDIIWGAAFVPSPEIRWNIKNNGEET